MTCSKALQAVVYPARHTCVVFGVARIRVELHPLKRSYLRGFLYAFLLDSETVTVSVATISVRLVVSSHHDELGIVPRPYVQV